MYAVYGKSGYFLTRLAGELYAGLDLFNASVNRDTVTRDAMFFKKSKLLAPLAGILMITAQMNPGGLFDDYGSRYWITRGAFECHMDQMERRERGGIKDTITAFQLRIITEEYRAVYSFEQMIDEW